MGREKMKLREVIGFAGIPAIDVAGEEFSAIDQDEAESIARMYAKRVAWIVAVKLEESAIGTELCENHRRNLLRVFNRILKTDFEYTAEELQIPASENIVEPPNQ